MLKCEKYYEVSAGHCNVEMVPVWFGAFCAFTVIMLWKRTKSLHKPHHTWRNKIQLHITKVLYRSGVHHGGSLSWSHHSLVLLLCEVLLHLHQPSEHLLDVDPLEPHHYCHLHGSLISKSHTIYIHIKVTVILLKYS